MADRLTMLDPQRVEEFKLFMDSHRAPQSGPQVLTRAGPKPFDELPRPAPNSSLLARYLYLGSLPSYGSAASAIQRAQTEITSRRAGRPLALSVSDMGAISLTAGGLDGLDPWLEVVPRKGGNVRFADAQMSELGFADMADRLLAVDEHRLVFASDGHRVKSYHVRANGVTAPVHTFRGTNGHLAMSEDAATVMQLGGGGRVLSWTLAKMRTHGSRGDRIVGGPAMSLDDLDSAFSST